MVNDKLLAADGFDAAIIGTATREEAEEFFSFNTEGAWVGDKTPAYVWTLK